MRLFLACVVLSVAAQAATINTTINVMNATASFSGTAISATGPVTLTNIGSGNFTATLSIQASAGNLTGPFTITLTGTPTVGSAGDTITGTVTASVSILGGTGTGSATVTGGTGAFANATGSFNNASVLPKCFSLSLSFPFALARLPSVKCASTNFGSR